jgi:sulfur-oxidizing protein SoxY
MAQSRRKFIRMLAMLPALVAPMFGRAAPKSPQRAEDRFGALLAETLAGASWMETDRIFLDVPEVAENGAIVPISVESRLPNTSRVFIFVEKNPNPLAARIHFRPGTDGFVSLRLKMNETSPILVLAKSEGQFFGTQRVVQVMIGGCG